MITILVTGANGFVGKITCAALSRRGYQVKAAIRALPVSADLDEYAQFILNHTCSLSVLALPPSMVVDRTDSLPVTALPPSMVVVGDINGQTDWHTALSGVDVVIHLAARVHVMHETAADALFAFRLVNTVGTENLARQAVAAGVKRFIFLSSIKVFGEHALAEAFTEDTPASPADDYALSKWEAEQELQKMSAISNMELVVIRPPLVYGAGVKGNFLRLMRLVKCGLPLPFASISNQRSMVYVENLADLIGVCVEHPAAAGHVLLCADAEDFSTPALIRGLAKALGAPARLWPMPVSVFKKIARLVNKQAEVERLCDSMQVDTSQTQALLNWRPPYTAAQGIAVSVADFLVQRE
ncbi:MAG: SDR family oxidoreductase [Methylococcaceae bacterium]